VPWEYKVSHQVRELVAVSCAIGAVRCASNEKREVADWGEKRRLNARFRASYECLHEEVSKLNHTSNDQSEKKATPGLVRKWMGTRHFARAHKTMRRWSRVRRIGEIIGGMT